MAVSTLRNCRYSPCPDSSNSANTMMESRKTATIKMYIRITVRLFKNTVIRSMMAKASKTKIIAQF